MKVLFAIGLIALLSGCSNSIIVHDYTGYTDEDGDKVGCGVVVSEKATGTFSYKSEKCVVEFTK